MSFRVLGIGKHRDGTDTPAGPCGWHHAKFSDWAGVQNATALIADPTIPVQVTCTAVAGSTGSVSVVPESILALAITLSVSRCR